MVINSVLMTRYQQRRIKSRQNINIQKLVRELIKLIKKYSATEKILQDPKTKVLPDVKIRGENGHGYYNPNYGGENGAFVGIPTEGKMAGKITKVQPLSAEQLRILREFNKID